jgi:hypothetical protein
MLCLIEVRRVGGATFQIKPKIVQIEKFYGDEMVNFIQEEENENLWSQLF